MTAGGSKERNKVDKRYLKYVGADGCATKACEDRQDYVDACCFNLISELANGTQTEWDINLITKIRMAVQQVICEDLELMSELDFYPWIDEWEDETKE